MPARYGNDSSDRARVGVEEIPTQDKTDIYKEEHTDLAFDLIHKIQIKARNSAAFLSKQFEYYSKIRVGRRCSCWNILKDTPSSHCKACFGEGIVGGFEKMGYKSEVLDVTFANSSSINVVPYFQDQTSPTCLGLAPNALYGILTFPIWLQSFAKSVEQLRLVASQTGIDAYIQQGGTVYDLDLKNLELVSMSYRKFNVVVEFSRQSLKAEIPKLSLAYLRFQVIDKTTFTGDVPKHDQSKVISDLGVVEQYASRNLWMDALSVKDVSPDDFITELETGKRWKITSVNPNYQSHRLMSWDCNTRYIQDYENYLLVP